MQTNKPTVIALMGPTASGKTELAIDIAKKINSNIHNVDSRQIYVDMNIGTAKPTLEQQKQIKHFLIDLCLPSKPINLHDFQGIANLSIEKDLKKQKLILLVGGSGLYLQSLLRGLEPPPVPPQEFLRNQLQKLEDNERHNILRCCDPIAAGKISPKDSTRTIRSLEVFYATGKTISSQKNLKTPHWRILEFCLNPENLNFRIRQRTEEMYKNGLIEETENIMIKYGKDIKLLKTIGYEEARSVIKGELNYDEALSKTIQRTCQFAKRQKTWFKNKHKAKLIHDENPLKEALSSIYEFLG